MKAKIHVAQPEDKLLQRAILIEIIMMKISQPKLKSTLLYPFPPPVTRPGKAATKIGAFCDSVCMTQFLQSTDYIYPCKRHQSITLSLFFASLLMFLLSLCSARSVGVLLVHRESLDRGLKQ